MMQNYNRNAVLNDGLQLLHLGPFQDGTPELGLGFAQKHQMPIEGCVKLQNYIPFKIKQLKRKTKEMKLQGWTSSVLTDLIVKQFP